MTDTDRSRFGAALVALAEVFGGELSATAQALYFAALADLPWETLQVGLRRAIAECRFLPKPIELRELSVGTTASAEDRGESAWLAWRYAARVVGSYQSLAFVDRALAATLEAMFGGWPEACVAEFSDEMWAAKRKEFGRVYRVMVGRVESGEPIELPGQHARHNLIAGHAGIGDGRRPLLTAQGLVEWQPGARTLGPGAAAVARAVSGGARAFPRLCASSEEDPS